MDRYKRRDDGSHFDSQQARDSRGRFASEPKKKRAAESSDRRPGESDSDYLERKGIEASDRATEIFKRFEEKFLPKI